MGLIENLLDIFVPNRLNRMQVWALNNLNIDDIVMHADKHSLKQGSDPNQVYIFYKRDYIGTAYGKYFSFDEDFYRESEEVAGVIRKIMESYLPHRDRIKLKKEN